MKLDVVVVLQIMGNWHQNVEGQGHEQTNKYGQKTGGIRDNSVSNSVKFTLCSIFTGSCTVVRSTLEEIWCTDGKPHAHDRAKVEIETGSISRKRK